LSKLAAALERDQVVAATDVLAVDDDPENRRVSWAKPGRECLAPAGEEASHRDPGVGDP